MCRPRRNGTERTKKGEREAKAFEELGNIKRVWRSMGSISRVGVPGTTRCLGSSCGFRGGEVLEGGRKGNKPLKQRNQTPTRPR